MLQGGMVFGSFLLFLERLTLNKVKGQREWEAGAGVGAGAEQEQEQEQEQGLTIVGFLASSDLRCAFSSRSRFNSSCKSLISGLVNGTKQNRCYYLLL
jgi:hypothetical protein